MIKSSKKKDQNDHKKDHNCLKKNGLNDQKGQIFSKGREK